MKKFISIVVILIGLSNCTQNTIAPTAPPIVPTTVTLSTTETSLLGNWAYDKTQLYSNGVMVTTPGGTVIYNDPNIYHLRFNSTSSTSPLDPSAPAGTYKECIDGTSGSDHTNYWQVTTSGKLNIGGSTYSIDSLTTNNLIYYTGSLTTGSAIRYSFHKI